MQFNLEAKGSVSECREALNAEIAKLASPHKQEHTVVRSAAHYIVEENLDPLYVPWAEAINALRAAGVKESSYPPEPQSSFKVSISIEVQELARQ